MNLLPNFNPIQGSFDAESQDFWTINWQQFTELLTFVDFAADEKLTIAFVKINFDRDLDILIEGLKTHHRCQDIQFKIFNLDDKNLWSVREELMKGLKQLERDGEKKLVLIVRGLASSIGLSGEYPVVLQTLNLNRDAFEITVPHPIIFCLPDYAMERLSRYAPDFWVWKSGVFDFEATQKTEDTAIASSRLSDGFLERSERPEKPERIEFLHSSLMKYSRSNYHPTPGDLNGRISLLNELGVTYRSQGKFDDARDYLSEALELANTQEKPRNTDLALKAGVLRNLGTIDVANKDFDSAIAYYQQALEIEEEIGNFLGKADTLERMTYLYASKLGLKGTLSASEYAEAERLLVEVWTLKKRLLGDSHPDLAISRNNLALLYQYQGRYAEAEPLYLEALALRKELLGSLGADFATITNNLARVYQARGRYEEAEPLYLEALAEKKELLGDKHPDVATSMSDLAGLYQSHGRYTEAKPLYLEALALRKELLGSSHPDVIATTNNLAQLLLATDRPAEAEALMKEAAEIAKVSPSTNDEQC